jgi:DNA-directed RNA polymerase subunit RPC12/RpoP
VRRKRSKFEEKPTELPLVCADCKAEWTRIVGGREKRVQCPRCEGFRVSVVPPCKILEFHGPRHYNTAGKQGARQAPEPVAAPGRAVKKLGVRMLRDLREVAEEYDVEVIEEIG